MNHLAPLQLEAMVAALALGTLVLEAIRPFRDVRRLGWFLACALIAILAYSFTIAPTDALFFSGTYGLDAFALFFKRLFLLIAALALVTTAEYAPRLGHGVAEHVVLLLLATVGALVLGSSVDFILLFVALELVTLSALVLVSHQRDQMGSLEAGIKYLVMGGVSTGLLVYGISYVFGTTGASGFAAVAAAIGAQGGGGSALALGILLVLLGLGFKIAAVPSQMWAPDVYEGAPLSATAFLATGSKLAGVAALVRLLFGALLPAVAVWGRATIAVAILTLLYGTLGALRQRDLKRLSGYSSIAHAGFLLMGVVAASPLGLAAVLYYVVQYAVAVMAVFLALAVAARAGVGTTLADVAGLHRRAPLLAAAMAVGMLSMAGVPPLAGFFGKLLLFTALVQAAPTSIMPLALAGTAALCAIIGFVYYFGVVRSVYVDDPADPTPIPVSMPVRIVLLALIAALLALGLYQRPLLDAASAAVSVFHLAP